MDQEILDQKWDEMAKATFNQFISDYVGTKDENEGKPDCFGTGNDRKYCVYCPYKPSCGDS